MIIIKYCNISKRSKRRV